MKVTDVIKSLKSYDPEEEVAMDLWSTADVRSFCDDNGLPGPTKAEADATVVKMGGEKDCGVGLNWGFLEACLPDRIKDSE